MDRYMNTDSIQLITKNVSLLDENRKTIVDAWLSNTEVSKILAEHAVEKEFFAINYAHPVLNYFIGVIEGTNLIGNCPVISKLLEYLKHKNISSSQLFIICINFRKSMVHLFFQKNLMNEEIYDNISFIFDANFRGVLELFSETISQAKAESKRLYDISTKDHLTKIFNRKKFDEIFVEEIQAVNNVNKNLALILIDIDHFKNVNDAYGHETGDNVLVNLTTVVHKYIRRSDIFARWGGEEFVILMPNANKENAYHRAELMRKAIASYPFEKVGTITCSFGITDYTQAKTQSSMFSMADQALYSSKAAGRNKITVV